MQRSDLICVSLGCCNRLNLSLTEDVGPGQSRPYPITSHILDGEQTQSVTIACVNITEIVRDADTDQCRSSEGDHGEYDPEHAQEPKEGRSVQSDVDDHLLFPEMNYGRKPGKEAV